MAKKIIRDIPLNRVEGDLEIRVELENNRIVDAWSSGTMFRGIENILRGRGALDGLVITPRVCGICSTTHLMAAAKALDQIAAVSVPDNAVRLRNLTLMVEHCQSDVRHSVLMFLPDFAAPIYQAHPLYTEAVKRYAPLQGERCIDVVRQTKTILEIIAILGGQWPHSSFMVPGGVTYVPTMTELNQCRHILQHYRKWYEQTVLGCSLERWQAVRSATDLDAWLAEGASHRESDTGFFLRFAREAGLHALGQRHGCFLSYGSLDLPGDTAIVGAGEDKLLVAAGFVGKDGQPQRFDQAQVKEHVGFSWYTDYPGGRHPFEGETDPQATGAEGKKYSWAKAPRYLDQPAETGPLAERIVGGDPLFCDLLRRDGANLVIRQLARMTRPATLFPAMETWVDEMIARHDQPYYTAVPPLVEGRGFGLIEAARGALGHWVEIKDGKISHYQIVTPTAWNGSPRDSEGVRGPWEEALIGTAIKDIDNPVEAGHVVRSFDACLVCTVHVVGPGRIPVRC
ncbi:MAG: nickel-dependent hydrogenase large subunit [Proteobacteria bacterium]|nr:nickel-dependent hydrogenase large subunit [Pseudomonadota bacterium]